MVSSSGPALPIGTVLYKVRDDQNRTFNDRTPRLFVALVNGGGPKRIQIDAKAEGFHRGAWTYSTFLNVSRLGRDFFLSEREAWSHFAARAEDAIEQWRENIKRDTNGAAVARAKLAELP